MYPTPSQVLAGVQYGPTGTEFVGTAALFADRFTVLLEELDVLAVTTADSQTVNHAWTLECEVSLPVQKRLFVFTQPDAVTVSNGAQTLTVVEVRV